MNTEVQKFSMMVAAGLIALGGVAFLQGEGPAVLGPFLSKGTAVKRPSLIRVRAGDPELTAEAALAMRVKSGETLYERNGETRLPIASLTKLMSALLLVEREAPLAKVIFSERAKGAGKTEDKRSAVPAGEAMKAEDVIKMLLISSDGDAAWAAAEYAAVAAESALERAGFEDRIAAFVRRMNDRAQTLGLANTRFANPAGNDNPENYSTARDLAHLAAFIAEERPELWAASRIQETFVFGASGGRYGLVNTNPLLGEYPAIFGSKTGFDDEARGALLLLYQLAPDDFVALVLLRSRDRVEDGREFIRWLEESFVIESK